MKDKGGFRHVCQANQFPPLSLSLHPKQNYCPKLPKLPLFRPGNSPPPFHQGEDSVASSCSRFIWGLCSLLVAVRHGEQGKEPPSPALLSLSISFSPLLSLFHRKSVPFCLLPSFCGYLIFPPPPSPPLLLPPCFFVSGRVGDGDEEGEEGSHGVLSVLGLLFGWGRCQGVVQAPEPVAGLRGVAKGT
ncbi:uncharacterized protein LOC103722143 isoform X3 [Phoenix dactylifera]|uniref:Uncharacterized protein LOC103722143 isoform X3 n=1 Tax=Phoenix dactylifera TaxID=42345 RepID=A0A8B9AL92_PHODC|nr:uncharacterized protein LOC103722143 isoform X3 [Phoenix dactylifera]